MAAPSDDDEEWRFSLEDLQGEEGEDGEGHAGEESPDEQGDGNVAGTLSTDEPVEPGDIDRENAIFLVVGILIAVLFFGSAVVLLL